MSDTKEVSTLAAKVVTTVVTVLGEAIQSAQNSGATLIDAFKAMAKAGFPKIPSEADVVLVADQLSAKLGWAGTPREKVSKSEARSLIRQHALLPEAITALRSSAYGRCGYHDAVKVARAIKEHGNVGDAVLALNTKAEATKTDPAVRAASALKSWYASVRDGRKTPKRLEQMKAIVNFATEMGLDIGLGQ
jgi:hypothetical protein